MNEVLLAVRKEAKERKPEFIRQDYPKRMKVHSKWRKPKGLHSKIRHHFKGRRKMPSPGYKSPRNVKGLHSSGLEIVSVFSSNDIKKIINGQEGAVIAKSTGMKKRLEMLKIAKELGVAVLNLNVDEQIKKIEELMSSKKGKAAKETKKEESKAAKENREKIKTESLSDKQKKEEEKKERDKVLTKKV